MKKMMTVLAACAVTSLALADGGVVSANIVGYMNKTPSGQFFTTGSMFISVGDSNKKWRLSDVTATGMDPTVDNIQFLNSTTVDLDLAATYVDAAHAAIYHIAEGWWNLDLDTPLGNTQIDAGIGFLCNISTPGVNFMYKGEVRQGTSTLNLTGQQFPMVVNFTPVNLTLSNVTATGMDPTVDNIQFLNPTTVDLDLAATYVDAAYAAIYHIAEGWWNLDLDIPLGSTPLPSGVGFLCNFGTKGVSITFPTQSY